MAGWAPCFKSKRNCCFDIPVADSGEGPGGARPPLFLDQNESQRTEDIFWRPPPTSLPQDLDDCPLLISALYPTKLFKDPYFLTIIPRARMGSEPIAHDAEGRMGY